MDHHVPRAITNGLRLRGVDVLTAHEDGAVELRNPELLDRASELGREATDRQRRGQPFVGVIFAHQLRVSVGDCVRDLKVVAEAGAPDDLAGQTLFLPL